MHVSGDKVTVALDQMQVKLQISDVELISGMGADWKPTSAPGSPVRELTGLVRQFRNRNEILRILSHSLAWSCS